MSEAEHYYYTLPNGIVFGGLVVSDTARPEPWRYIKRLEPVDESVDFRGLWASSLFGAVLGLTLALSAYRMTDGNLAASVTEFFAGSVASIFVSEALRLRR